MNCYYFQSPKLCTENEGIHYSLNDDNLILAMATLLCLCERLFICALWSPAGKGLTSWLSFVMSIFEFVTFPLVSWVRCGTLLYRFLIFAPLLTLKIVLSVLQHSIQLRTVLSENSQIMFYIWHAIHSLWTVILLASKMPSNKDTLDEQSLVYF